MSEFKREQRYCVIKLTDLHAAGVTDKEMEALDVVCNKVLGYRIDKGKGLLECVVVEHDWPEYEPTWEAIRKRVSKSTSRSGMNIILNGRTVRVGESPGLFPEVYGQVSYDDICEWSGHGRGRILTVTYCTRRAGDEQREGSLTPGKSVTIEDGMVFSVADTSNA